MSKFYQSNLFSLLFKSPRYDEVQEILKSDDEQIIKKSIEDLGLQDNENNQLNIYFKLNKISQVLNSNSPSDIILKEALSNFPIKDQSDFIQSLQLSFIIQQLFQSPNFKTICSIYRLIIQDSSLYELKPNLEKILLVKILSVFKTQIQDKNQYKINLFSLSTIKNLNLLLEHTFAAHFIIFSKLYPFDSISDSSNSEDLFCRNSSFENPLLERNTKDKQALMRIFSYSQISLLKKPIYQGPKGVFTVKVLLALVHQTQEIIAVKITESDSERHINIEEAKILMDLNGNDFVVRCYGFISDINPETKKHRLAIFLEKADESLKDDIKYWLQKDKETIKAEKTSRENEALEALQQLITGMMSLRNLNVWYRDIKPGNVLIFKQNGVKKYKLTDFNASCRYKRDDRGVTQIEESSSNPPYTKDYAAPELISKDCQTRFGIKKNSFNFNKSDIYSLGLTIFNMITESGIGSWNRYNDSLQYNMDRYIEENIENTLLKESLMKMIKVDPSSRIEFAQLYREICTSDVTYHGE
ncbi:hypothetical protein SteCoe_5010 [Stentor coeruleus]|uniref:mitogen-activated protein kinase kinase n=1 Tax=Stentor coeruleus TaxID=5963 RepID=A0A1R2CTC5_9CILI|nr:hypothetical protein SteCoe_5010 [Stentor coeruleus]